MVGVSSFVDDVHANVPWKTESFLEWTTGGILGDRKKSVDYRR